ncbi:hypothetical protein GCM10007108_00700 [Thermogymnomonas acidicola]|uniref:Zinc finger ZPR1-type domain-containing protein n=1 Tax=Thermogymnomonas acidicola TaxID=399579 RepID=A0AA37BPR1_9ARCH|nr:ZPR1 zinc finger domain-containing protein [Thermogymnomonas acidicola]GGM66343.1 hypothetical protein GCM10007108_00700 [Thermogymnomonas acidicola]
MNPDDELPADEETEIECPQCRTHLHFIRYTTRIAFEGEITIQTYYCPSCQYRHTDTIRKVDSRPKRTWISVRSSDDLRIIVYRSPEGKITIPEMGAEIEPGIASTGEITTIEGIMARIREHMWIAFRDYGESQAERDLDDILAGRVKPFTLVIDDPTGKSTIRSSRAVEVMLTDGP